MDKELEKELKEVVKEMMRPENRQKLLLVICLGMNMASANTVHHGRRLDTIRGKTFSFGDPLFNDYVKDMIERNEEKLKDIERIVNVNYSLINEKSLD